MDATNVIELLRNKEVVAVFTDYDFADLEALVASHSADEVRYTALQIDPALQRAQAACAAALYEHVQRRLPGPMPAELIPTIEIFGSLNE